MEKSKKITMKTIADEVGVSITTVSHVINRTRAVDIEIRLKIIEAAERLGYKKSRSRNSNMNRLTAHIGLIIPDIREHFFSKIIKTVESVANENGYTLLIADSEYSEEKEVELVKTFLNKQIHGLVLGSVFEKPDELEKLPLFNSIPTVLIDRKWDTKKYDFIGIDNFKSAFDATNLLINKGYRKTGYLALKAKSTTISERYEGYKTAMLAAGLRENCGFCELDMQKDTTSRILAFARGRDAVFCFNPNVCYEAVAAFTGNNMRIPEDIAILTHDDNRWFDLLKFPLPVVRQPHGEIALAAIELLIRKINSGETEGSGKQLLFPTELIDRLDTEYGGK